MWGNLKDGSSNIRVRSGPGTNYGTVTNTSYYDGFLIIGRSSDNEWFKIGSLSAEPMWIAAQYVDYYGDLSDIPVLR
jgi:uncharacterized protein YraI